MVICTVTDADSKNIAGARIKDYSPPCQNIACWVESRCNVEGKWRRRYRPIQGPGLSATGGKDARGRWDTLPLKRPEMWWIGGSGADNQHSADPNSQNTTECEVSSPPQPARRQGIYRFSLVGQSVVEDFGVEKVIDPDHEEQGHRDHQQRQQVNVKKADLDL